MPFFRQIVRTVAAIGAPVVLAPVAGEWFVKLAEERGLYAEPSSRLERVMNWLVSWTTLPWFDFVAGLVIGLAVGIWLDYLLRLRERRFAAAAPAAREAVPSGPTDRTVYVGRVHVDASRLASDFLLEFCIIAFNAAGAPLRLTGLLGTVAYAPATSTPDKDCLQLPPPVVREDNGTKFAAGSEFMVIVSQRVPGALAAEMARDLSAGKRVMFVLEELHITLTAEFGFKPVRLPVWNRISLDRSGNLTVVMPIATARLNLVT